MTMERLQKKCMVVSAGFHLALLLVLLFGPAFRTAPEKPKRASQISLVSALAIEAALSAKKSSETVAQATPPAPPVEPPPEAKPEPKKIIPEKPKPVVVEKIDPPKPLPREEPKPKVAEKPKVIPKPEPAPPKKQKPKPKPPEIKINFNATQKKSDPVRERREADLRREREEAQKQKRAAAARLREMNQSLDSLGNSLSERSEITSNLVGGTALGNYPLFVKRAYNRAWVEPTDIGRSRAVVRVRVIVNLDGTVKSATIVGPSGNASLDQSVRDAIGRVKRIDRRPPAETSVAERTYTINFNLKDGRISE